MWLRSAELQGLLVSPNYSYSDDENVIEHIGKNVMRLKFHVFLPQLINLRVSVHV